MLTFPTSYAPVYTGTTSLGRCCGSHIHRPPQIVRRAENPSPIFRVPEEVPKGFTSGRGNLLCVKCRLNPISCAPKPSLLDCFSRVPGTSVSLAGFPFSSHRVDCFARYKAINTPISLFQDIAILKWKPRPRGTPYAGLVLASIRPEVKVCAAPASSNLA